MALPLVATEFWIGTEPDLQFTSGGRGYCKFRVKAVDRIKDDSAQGGFRDGKTLWATATVWDGTGAKATAQHAFESFKKGDNVLLSGKIYTREYEQNGEKRMSVDIDVQEIGPSLHFRTTPHGGTQSENQNQSSQPPASQNQQSASNTATGGSESDYPF